MCKLPAVSKSYGVVSIGDSLIGAHTIGNSGEGGLVVGGTLSDGSPLEPANFGGHSYVNEIDPVTGFLSNWNFGKTLGPTSIAADMFDYMAYLADNAIDYEDNTYMVKIFDDGGSKANPHSLTDFKRNGQEGQPNEGKKNLAIFTKTAGDVYIGASKLGRQFGGTIIAPYSKV